MRLTIKRKNLRGFASLSALSAGVLALTSGSANADVIHVVANAKIGFDAGFSPSFSISIDAVKRFTFQATSAAVETGFQWRVRARAYCAFLSNCNTRFPDQNSVIEAGKLLRAFSSGADWPGVPGMAGGLVAARVRSTLFPGGTIKSLITNFDSTNPYFLFRFVDNGNTLYGWGQVTVAGSSTTGPDVTLIDYAYDTTGAFIPAGQTSGPATPTPEPSPTIPLALSALVLGAPAIRRWRAAKTA